MRNIILIFFILLTYSKVSACSCTKQVSFIKGAKHSDIAILGKITDRQFKIDDGTVLNKEGDVKEYFIKNKGKVFFYVEILTIEIVESIRSKMNKGEKIKLHGGNANSCWSSLSKLKKDKLYVLSLNESYALLPYTIKKTDIAYELNVCCYSSSLELSSDKKNVTGIIRKKKVKTIPYRKLIQKIT